MTKTRLEAFSDGVLAIIITIMVLELRVPHGNEWEDLLPLAHEFLSYLFSFVFIGIYWGNHHHLLHTVRHVTSGIIWSNMLLLFFLSLIPFATAWMGENSFGDTTVAAYATLLLLCGSGYYVLQSSIRKHHHFPPALDKAMKKQAVKGIISQIAYAISIPVAFLFPPASALLFVFVAVLWIIPDKNIENALKE